jgi:hypothetical protein
MHRKVKQIQYDISIGTICTKVCLASTAGYAPQHLGLVDLQTPHVRPSPPFERLPRQRVLHVMTMHVY